MRAASPLTQRALKAFGYLLDKPGKSFAVAVSGGSDSMALLALAADFRAQTGFRFAALTVDHGLRPEVKAEARLVGRTCAALEVEHHVVRWSRKDDGPVSQDAARRARHTLMAQWARRRGHSCIAIGHTLDDRLETFLMRARQGSGWHGLAGLTPDSYSPVWPEGRDMRIVRPLLAFSREELREELRARNIAWVEDPSNEADRFERVRMRRLLARVAPASREKAVAAMNRLMRLRAAVAAEAASLANHVRENDDQTEVDIRLQARNLVGAEAWLRFIEAIVMAAGGAPHPPRRDALERLLARIATRDPGLARGVTLAGAKVRIRKDVFLAFSRAPPRRGAALPAEDEGPDWGRAWALLHAPDLRVLSV